jgi:hypothetical protein
VKEFQLGQHPAGSSVNKRENGFRRRFLSEPYPLFLRMRRYLTPFFSYYLDDSSVLAMDRLPRTRGMSGWNATEWVADIKRNVCAARVEQL